MSFKQWQTARSLEDAISLLENGCKSLNYVAKKAKGPKHQNKKDLHSLIEYISSNENFSCKALAISGVKILPEHIEAFSAVFAVHDELNLLKLSALKNECADALSALISRCGEHGNLEELQLPYSSFDVDNLNIVIQSVSSNKKLKELTFGGVEIPEEMSKILDDFLQWNRNLCRDDAQNNDLTTTKQKFDKDFLKAPAGKGKMAGFLKVFTGSSKIKPEDRSAGSIKTLSSDNPLYNITL